MTDHRESTLRPWKDSPLRETFLLHVTDPESRGAIVHLGDLFLEMVLDWKRHWPDHEEPSTTRAALLSIAGDRSFLAGYLVHEVADDLDASGVKKEDARLCLLAEDPWAPKLRAVAGEIREALGLEGE